MGLPIDLFGVLWVVPKALWEPEPEATKPAGQDPASLDGEASATLPLCTDTSGSPDEDGNKPSPLKLVFKGFTFDYDYAFHLVDSALIQPWTKCEDDDLPAPRAAKPLPSIHAEEPVEEVDQDWSQELDGIDADLPTDPEADPA